MNFGGRPAGQSAGVEARKRKEREHLDPDLKKEREDQEKQARQNFFKPPFVPAGGGGGRSRGDAG